MFTQYKDVFNPNVTTFQSNCANYSAFHFLGVFVSLSSIIFIFIFWDVLLSCFFVNIFGFLFILFHYILTSIIYLFSCFIFVFAQNILLTFKIHKRLITHTFSTITPTQLRSSRDLRVINHAVVRIVSKTHIFSPAVIAQKLLHSCSVLETASRTSLRLLSSLQLSLLRRF